MQVLSFSSDSGVPLRLHEVRLGATRPPKGAPDTVARVLLDSSILLKTYDDGRSSSHGVNKMPVNFGLNVGQ
jgi:hypothetical protein